MKRRENKTVVLDTWAMLAYLDGEPAAQQVRQILRKARKKQVLVLFSLINYGECLYVTEREQGLQQAQRAEENLRRGMTLDDARYAARRSFGGVDQMKEQHRCRRLLSLTPFRTFSAPPALSAIQEHRT